jgi:hypothetical protein
MSSRARRAHFEAGSYFGQAWQRTRPSTSGPRSVELPQHRAAEISQLDAAGLTCVEFAPAAVQAQADGGLVTTQYLLVGEALEPWEGAWGYRIESTACWQDAKSRTG